MIRQFHSHPQLLSNFIYFVILLSVMWRAHPCHQKPLPKKQKQKQKQKQNSVTQSLTQNQPNYRSF